MERLGQDLVAGMILTMISTVLLSLLLSLSSFLHVLGGPGKHLGPRLYQYLWNRRGMFWFVNAVCMLFSAQNAGYLFGIYEPLSGWGVGLVLDLLIIFFTQSMLGALARDEKRRASGIMVFISSALSSGAILNVSLIRRHMLRLFSYLL